MIPPQELRYWRKWSNAVANALSNANVALHEDLVSEAMVTLVRMWPRVCAHLEQRRGLIKRRIIGTMFDYLRRESPRNRFLRNAKRCAKRRNKLFDKETVEIPKVFLIEDLYSFDKLALSNPAADPEQQFVQREQRLWLEEQIAGFPHRHRVILQYFLEEENAKVIDLEAQLQISASRVCQLRSDAVTQLREAYRLRESVPPMEEPSAEVA